PPARRPARNRPAPRRRARASPRRLSQPTARSAPTPYASGSPAAPDSADGSRAPQTRAVRRTSCQHRPSTRRRGIVRGVSDNPTALLERGVAELAGLLGPAGFEFIQSDEGVDSGGPFASGEFLKGDRRLE